MSSLDDWLELQGWGALNAAPYQRSEPMAWHDYHNIAYWPDENERAQTSLEEDGHLARVYAQDDNASPPPGMEAWIMDHKHDFNKDKDKEGEMLKRAGKTFAQSPIIRVLVYGMTGSGKTTWGAMCPNPLIVMTEPNAEPTIANVNPMAWPWPCTSWRAFQAAIDKLSTCQKADPTGLIIATEEGESVVSTLVIDSLTDLHVKCARENSKGEDVNWTRVAVQWQSTMNKIRNLPINVVGICLAKTSEDDNGRRSVKPKLFGQEADQVGQYFNGVCLAYQQGPGHRLDFHWGSSRVPTKRLPGSRGTVPDQIWFDPLVPGAGTLGSLLLALYPDANLVTAEGDSADMLTWSPDDEEENLLE